MLCLLFGASLSGSNLLLNPSGETPRSTNGLREGWYAVTGPVDWRGRYSATTVSAYNESSAPGGNYYYFVPPAVTLAEIQQTVQLPNYGRNVLYGLSGYVRTGVDGTVDSDTVTLFTRFFDFNGTLVNTVTIANAVGALTWTKHQAPNYCAPAGTSTAAFHVRAVYNSGYRNNAMSDLFVLEVLSIGECNSTRSFFDRCANGGSEVCAALNGQPCVAHNSTGTYYCGAVAAPPDSPPTSPGPTVIPSVTLVPTARVGDVATEAGGEQTTVIIASVTVVAIVLVGAAVGMTVFFLVCRKRKGTISTLSLLRLSVPWLTKIGGSGIIAPDGFQGDSWYFQPDTSWTSLSDRCKYKTIIEKGIVKDYELHSTLQKLLTVMPGQYEIRRAYAIANPSIKVIESRMYSEPYSPE